MWIISNMYQLAQMAVNTAIDTVVSCATHVINTSISVKNYVSQNVSSVRSLTNFAKTNVFLISLGTIQYGLLSYFPVESNFTTHVLVTTAILLSKNYIMIWIVDYNLASKKSITPRNHLSRTVPIETYLGEFHLNVMSSTMVEAGTTILIKKFYTTAVYDYGQPNIHFFIYDLILFIPISFLFELIFDFFHYWSHRLVHLNRFLYINIHKKHHKFRYPTTILTFYQEPLDIILTNSIPTILTLTIMPSISVYMFTLILIYKSYIEICGHTGKNVEKTSAFVQFIWLPKKLNIELYTEDHDLHHTQNNGNYSKRFSLYDKIFKTYRC